MPELIANKILAAVRIEKHAILWLCLVTAFLSAFMENVGVVLIKNIRAMVLEFDWNSFLFITGALMVIFTANTYGLLSDLAELVVCPGFDNPTLVLAFTIWISVTLSSFIDNVAFAILTIPVCQHLASLLQTTAWPLRYDHGCGNRR